MSLGFREVQSQHVCALFKIGTDKNEVTWYVTFIRYTD